MAQRLILTAVFKSVPREARQVRVTPSRSPWAVYASTKTSKHGYLYSTLVAISYLLSAMLWVSVNPLYTMRSTIIVATACSKSRDFNLLVALER